jgi:acetyl-CoA acetyltransferase
MSTRRSVNGRVLVAGVGYGEIGRNTGRTEGSLTTEACLAAVEDAGLTMADVDGLLSYPDRISSPFEGPSLLYMQRSLGLKELNYWQASSTTGPGQFAAVIDGVYAIMAGAADVVLCYRGHLRQSGRSYVAGGAAASVALDDQAFRAPYGAPAGAPRFALWAQRYMHQFGVTEEQLGAVVLTCRTNAQRNPRAVWYGHPLTMDDYFASDYVASPLRVLDCDYPIDGAVAVVLTRSDRRTDLRRRPVAIESVGHATGGGYDWDQWDDMAITSSAYAGRHLWSGTDLEPVDVDVAEVYDGFSTLALAWLEDLEFCGRGEAGLFVQEGNAAAGGKLPICTDGGQLGGGRLHGFGKLAEATLQLRGECGPRQVPGATVAVACSGGGTNSSVILLTSGA